MWQFLSRMPEVPDFARTGAVRGAIIGGGFGLAAAGLNMVRSQLMRAWRGN
jgi:hypothetical protein